MPECDHTHCDRAAERRVTYPEGDTRHYCNPCLDWLSEASWVRFTMNERL